MPSNLSRRDALKALSFAAASFPLSSWAMNEKGERIILPDNPLHKKLKKPVTAITLGAGSRGNVYGNYAVQYPDQLDIVGVAEPVQIRNERYTKSIAYLNKTGSTPGKMFLSDPNSLMQLLYQHPIICITDPVWRP